VYGLRICLCIMMAANVVVSNGLSTSSQELGTTPLYPPETLIAAGLTYNRLDLESGFHAFDQASSPDSSL
jgi:hypothetical protein